MSSQTVVDGKENVQIQASNSRVTVTIGTTKKDKPVTLDFSMYLQGFLEAYKIDPVAKIYENIGFRQYKISEIQEDDIDDPKVKGIWIDGKGILDDFVLDWLSNPTKRQISLIGDFGSGKTTFSRHLMYRMAQRHLTEPNKNRIPILLPLRNFNTDKGIKIHLLDFFRTNWGIKIDIQVFTWLLKSGKLCLILDGFDEMVARVTQPIRFSIFKLIADLTETPNKLILTGRPGFFPTQDEMYKIFGRNTNESSVYKHLESELSETLGNKLCFEILEIPPFQPGQIKSILSKHQSYFLDFGVKDWQDIWNTIDNTYDFKDLVSRPILLDVIIKTLPRLTNTIKVISPAKLYEIYTNYWCDVEWAKGEVRQLLTTDSRIHFMETLAWEMFQSQKFEVHYSEIHNLIMTHFEIKNADSIDWYEHDARTCQFLFRSDQGFYRFTHNSFMEYFIAKIIYTSLLDRTIKLKANFFFDPSLFIEKEIQLSQGITFFLKSILRDNDPPYYSQIIFFHRWAWAQTQANEFILMLAKNE
jgi:hypothetical protein